MFLSRSNAIATGPTIPSVIHWPLSISLTTKRVVLNLNGCCHANIVGWLEWFKCICTSVVVNITGDFFLSSSTIKQSNGSESSDCRSKPSTKFHWTWSWCFSDHSTIGTKVDHIWRQLIKTWCMPPFRFRQITREVDAPFTSRHNEHSEIYGDLVGEKNMYDQGFLAESKHFFEWFHNLVFIVLIIYFRTSYSTAYPTNKPEYSFIFQRCPTSKTRSC